MDFPCNQFGQQAPGNDDEIRRFCKSNYHVDFQQFSKVEVNGEQAHPLFVWLKEQKGGLLGNNIKWNFTKFLIDRQGNVVGRFAPQTPPDKMENEIKKLL